MKTVHTITAVLAGAAMVAGCASAGHPRQTASVEQSVRVRYVERMTDGGRTAYGRAPTNVRYVERSNRVADATGPQPVRVRYVERVSSRGQEVAVAPWSRTGGDDEAERRAFETRIRQRMDTIAVRGRDRAASGAVTDEAPKKLANERVYVESLLAQYGSDGVLNAEERQHIETAVGQMRDLVRSQPTTLAIGGGPRR